MGKFRYHEYILNVQCTGRAYGRWKVFLVSRLYKAVLLGSLFAQKESPAAAGFVRLCLPLELVTVAMLEHLYLQHELLSHVFTVNQTEVD